MDVPIGIGWQLVALGIGFIFTVFSLLMLFFR